MMNFLWAVATRAIEFVTRVLQVIVPPLARAAPYPPERHRREFSVDVVRPDDLLVVTFDFYNLRITPAIGGTPARLDRTGPGTGFLVVLFPPQSFAEQAFLEREDGSPDPTNPIRNPPVGSRIAGASQIVFRISDALLPLEFTLEALLDAMAKSEPIVQPRVTRPQSRPTVATGLETNFHGPRSQFTAIEAPYRLILSPNLESRWQHATAAVKDSAGKRTELWHTRLVGNRPRTSAVWSPDYAAGQPSPAPDDATPFRMSLNNENRHEIVRSTADPALAGAAPAEAEQFMLSSQGAWLNLHGQWATALNLVEWRHIATAGRDNYVRVVKEGNLFCLGHRAVFVKITERKVQMTTGPGLLEGKPAEYLRQRLLIIPREPTRTYAHRHMPFRTVTIKTIATPNLDNPATSDIFGLGENAFWPRVLGKDFEFHIRALDWEGRELEFYMPLAFIVKTEAHNAARMQQLVQHFNDVMSENDARRRRPIGGQKIAYAPAKVPNDTALETAAFVFGALNSNGSPRFLPRMHTADAAIPAVQRITGTNALSTIALDSKFLAGSGSAIGNMTDVFAYLTGKRTPVAFAKEKLGGMVAPDFDVSSISRAFGPMGGDPAAFASGSFDPAQIFKDIKLLGGIDLGSIIRPMINATESAAGQAVPGLKNVRTTKPGLGDVFETTYHWDIDDKFLQNSGIYQRKPGGTFSIHTVLDTPLNGAPPRLTVDGALTKFAVTLLPGADTLIALNFDRVGFHAGSDAKVDFAIVFDGFEFLGPLSFVNKLREFIPLDSFNDPPFLDVVLPPKPHPGVNVGFTLALPSIGIGIFTLQNISLSAGFFLPFIGEEPNLRFAFCERHQPFTLTVSLFGGGGFFALDIGMTGVRMIEAALEFGAAIALNLGVAKGSASVMGGVYYQKSGAGFAISAYFRAAGALEVLGIITVSVELYIALNYQSNKALAHGGKLWGEASVKVKIKIAFFSVSVSISIEREFAGSDPKFLETVTAADWTEYCDAFADYPA